MEEVESEATQDLGVNNTNEIEALETDLEQMKRKIVITDPVDLLNKEKTEAAEK